MVQTDSEPVRAHGESEAARSRRFQQMALPHLDAAYNLARWLCGNASDADDVVQEAFMRAFRFFDTFRGDSARPWLLAIVRRTGTRNGDDERRRTRRWSSTTPWTTPRSKAGASAAPTRRRC